MTARFENAKRSRLLPSSVGPVMTPLTVCVLAIADDKRHGSGVITLSDGSKCGLASLTVNYTRRWLITHWRGLSFVIGRLHITRVWYIVVLLHMCRVGYTYIRCFIILCTVCMRDVVCATYKPASCIHIKLTNVTFTLSSIKGDLRLCLNDFILLMLTSCCVVTHVSSWLHIYPMFSNLMYSMYAQRSVEY